MGALIVGSSMRLVESRFLEIEVADDAPQDVIVDASGALQLQNRAALGVQELAQESLIARRLILDRPVRLGIEARAEALSAEVEEPAQPLDGVVSDPLLLDELF